VVRAGILLAALALTLFMMREVGFEPRPLKLSTFGMETRKIASAGVTYGLKNPVVRPLLFVSAAQGVFMMYFFYSSQPFALDLLGRPDLIWVAGALTALFGLTSVVGNTFVSRLMKTRWGDRPATILAAGAAANGVLVAFIGIVGLLAPESGSPVSFALMVVAFSTFGVVFGICGPVRMAYVNRYCPKEQRATLLSLDSFFDEAGGMAGQPGLGWIAKTASIPVGYMIGAVFMGVAAPLYRLSGRAAADMEPIVEEEEPSAEECLPPDVQGPCPPVR
jgi:MFS family permease